MDHPGPPTMPATRNPCHKINLSRSKINHRRHNASGLNLGLTLRFHG